MKKFLVILVVVMVSSLNARAAFDVIVPSEININTTGNVGTALNAWGLLVATTDTLSLDDLQNATLTTTIDDTEVSVSSLFVNVDSLVPLAPSEVAGGLAGYNSTVFSPLLEAGESFKSPDVTFWIGSFNYYPNNYVATATWNATVMIGEEFVSYSTQVNFGDSSIEVVSGQRVSSVPEPATVLLLAFGLPFLLRRHRE